MFDWLSLVAWCQPWHKNSVRYVVRVNPIFFVGVLNVKTNKQYIRNLENLLRYFAAACYVWLTMYYYLLSAFSVVDFLVKDNHRALHKCDRSDYMKYMWHKWLVVCMFLVYDTGLILNYAHRATLVGWKLVSLLTAALPF